MSLSNSDEPRGFKTGGPEAFFNRVDGLGMIDGIKSKESLEFNKWRHKMNFGNEEMVVNAYIEDENVDELIENNQGERERQLDLREQKLDERERQLNLQAGDFMSQARQLAEKKKVTLTAAMKELARTRPQMHEAWKRRMAAVPQTGYFPAYPQV